MGKIARRNTTRALPYYELNDERPSYWDIFEKIIEKLFLT